MKAVVAPTAPAPASASAAMPGPIVPASNFAAAMLPVCLDPDTEERGGSKYDLVLDQKRGKAILRASKVCSVRDSPMAAAIWGKGKPNATAQDETAWAQNRRAHHRCPAE